MSDSNQGFFELILAQIRGLFGILSPDPERDARRRRLALQRAVSGLLLEMAFTDFDGDEANDEARRETKARAVAQLVSERFRLSSADAELLVHDLSRKENRYTSYYEPVALINRVYSAEQKAEFIAQLWRVAFADGAVDPYEDHYVRKIAELIYVSHTDFITAKLAVRAEVGGASQL
jgi:uncharacterized tellurite resistance protein B-like protein